MFSLHAVVCKFVYLYPGICHLRGKRLIFVKISEISSCVTIKQYCQTIQVFSAEAIESSPRLSSGNTVRTLCMSFRLAQIIPSKLVLMSLGLLLLN